MTGSISRQGTTISRYHSKRQKSRAITDDSDTAVSQSSPNTSSTSAIDVAISGMMRAANDVKLVAVPSRNVHRGTILAPSNTAQTAHFDAVSHKHSSNAADGPAKTPIDTAAMSLNYNDHLGSVWSRPLPPIRASLKLPQPVAPRAHDGPPRSSEINATTVHKARRVPTNDSERRVGCLSFIRYGHRRRRESEGSSSSSEPAKQESGNYIAVETSTRDWRPLEHPDLATISSPRGLDNLSPRSPYDMRHGAVQPQHFYTYRTSTDRQLASKNSLRESPVQRRISGTTTGSSLPDTRSGTTLSAKSSVRSKPLIDLTPQYQPPPQYRHKGHGYYPERLGSGKLVDYATSPKKE